MGKVGTAWRRIKSLWRRRQLDRDLEDELHFHLEMTAQANAAAGIDREESERAARRRFGNLAGVKEACHELWTLGPVEIWWQDLRYALRSLRKNPAFTAVALITLSLAIGANTAIFSVVNAVLLRALPYHDSDSLAMLWTSTPKDHADQQRTSIPNFEDWKSQSRAFEDMAFYEDHNHGTLVDLHAGGNEPEMIWYAWVSTNLFQVLGVAPVLGRSFSQQDEARGDRVIVLGHSLWSRRFAGSPSVLDQTLNLDGTDYQVIGVMPPSFQFPGKDTQLWAPAAASRWWPAYRANRSNPGVCVVGRLKPTSDIRRAHAQAQAELRAIAARLERQYPEANSGNTINLVPLQVQVLGRTVPFMLWILFSAVVFVLLIASTNVASLLLARSAAREREIAIRQALGAGRARLIRQMLTESVVLSSLAGAIGLPLAAWGVRALIALGPQDIPRLDEVSIDGSVLGFTLAVSVLTGVLFGLAPALKLSRNHSGGTVAAMGRGWRTGRYARPLRGALIAAQFAGAVVLLTGAGLLIRSFLAVLAVDTGFNPQHVLTMHLNFRGGGDDVYEQAIERIRKLPGVQAVGTINMLFVLEDSNLAAGLREVEGRPTEPRDRWSPLVLTPNSGDVFQALGVKLIKGRFFNDYDGERAPLAMIVNETMARRFWPGENPVGKRFKGYPGRDDEWVTVIGLVQDTRNVSLEKQPIAQMFPAPKQFKPGSLLVIRANAEPALLAATVRSVIRALDPRAVAWQISTLQQEMDAQTSQRRFQSYLLGLFSALALVLSGVGIYGLLHYSVAQRSHEIGIRMALGARAGDLLGMVIGEGLLLAAAGILAGLAGAMALMRVISSMLFGVTPADPTTFAAVGILLIAVALAACSIPALRATKVDPVVALRWE